MRYRVGPKPGAAHCALAGEFSTLCGLPLSKPFITRAHQTHLVTSSPCIEWTTAGWRNIADADEVACDGWDLVVGISASAECTCNGCREIFDGQGFAELRLRQRYGAVA